ncbi:BBT_HP_G0053830.mRNA.1.CDS.1 [Saccharomyces cerevisiae]|nr:BBT_HP_G0053830.mRNA.1.CDS.1 [Saccharomyces cerevisiae]CAI6696414.1 BBT_HP_G0053830.mRNA.1.CDS.1 [Saccharomyces cerevisiae]
MKERIVVDLGCRKTQDGLSNSTHAADLNLCGVSMNYCFSVFEWTKIIDSKIVYAGGAKSVDDLKLVDELSHGKWI